MSLGVTELLLIAVIVLVMFGAGRLPRIMGDIGSGIRQFKKGIAEAKGDTHGTTPAPDDKTHGQP